MARNFKGKTFTKILRGYAPDEVEEYIAYIDEEYRKLERTSGENIRKLALALRKLDEMNNYAEQLENQLDEQTRQAEEQIAKQKNQLILAAKQLQKQAAQPAPQAAEIAERAKKDAETIVSDARLQSEKIIAEAEELARSVREKILTEAEEKAERIILDAEEKISDNQRAARNMSLAAVDIYNEVCAFRDTLFAAYNTHIESIEEITAAAEVLLEDTALPGDAAVGEADESDVTDEAEVTEESEAESELNALEDLEVPGVLVELEESEAITGAEDVEEIEDFEDFEDIEEAEEIEAFEEAEEIGEPDFDELDADGENFEIIDDESDFYDVVDEKSEDISADHGDGNGFVELVDEDEADDAPVDIWAEFFNAEEEVTAAAPVEVPASIPTASVSADVPADMPADVSEDEPSDVDFDGDTYESYESYGEIGDEEELDETIEDLAQKYSNIYTDPLDDEDFEEDEDDGSYAPNAEYAWGDDMYAEPEDEEEAVEEDYFVDESEDEVDELDKLKQFFSADYDESLAKDRTYDTSSNSTTSIALSLNDFFEEGEDQVSDYSFGEEEDMDSLFERTDDRMSVTEEFDIIFGKMDSAQNVAEISRQPIIPAEEPKKHKKHKKF